MPLVRVVQIGLVKDERHPQQPLPEINAGLAIRAHQRDVMNPDDLDFLHFRFPNFNT